MNYLFTNAVATSITLKNSADTNALPLSVPLLSGARRRDVLWFADREARADSVRRCVLQGPWQRETFTANGILNALAYRRGRVEEMTRDGEDV